MGHPLGKSRMFVGTFITLAVERGLCIMLLCGLSLVAQVADTDALTFGDDLRHPLVATPHLQHAHVSAGLRPHEGSRVSNDTLLCFPCTICSVIRTSPSTLDHHCFCGGCASGLGKFTGRPIAAAFSSYFFAASISLSKLPRHVFKPLKDIVANHS